MPVEMTRRAFAFAPTTIDETNRTVDLIASTGAGVLRRDAAGPFLEVLDLKGVDLSRADGMPLLDSHRQDSLTDVIGRVVAIRMEGADLVATVQVSERCEAIWRDITRGIIRNVSIGYEPKKIDDRADPATGQRVRTVVEWELHEVSLVPVGADAGAKTRKAETMPTTTTATPPAPTTTGTETTAVTRARINQTIRSLVLTINLTKDEADALANEMIDAEATVEQAAERVNEERRKRATQTRSMTPHVEIVANHGSPDERRGFMAEALFTRTRPAHKPSDGARPYMGMTTLDMARECLRAGGISTTGLSPADTVRRALHTTSDFPQIFADTANRSMRVGYEAAPAVLKMLARQTTARDFRAKTSVQLGEAPTLEKVNEAGEFKYGTMAEAAESYRIDTFGKIIGLSRQAIVNDDIGAFTDLSGKFGMAAAEFEAQFLVDLLQAGSGLGPLMADGQRLFHSTHGNVAGSGGALSPDTLSAARLAMRKQTGLSGQKINARGKYLLVPPELETLGEKMLAPVGATTTDDVNVFGGKLELMVEARLSSATRWYISADPAAIEGLEYAYLQGEEGPQIETRAGFEVDGIEIKVRLDFGAAFLDWRGWYTNAGA